jgi:very-short-patch-repair endonuclease
VHNHLPSTLVRARRLRKEMSLPEVLLWRELRQRPGGLKFRKQHPIDGIVTDFFCHAASLAIEVDGITHDMSDQPEYDERRDAMLAQQGIRTLRITARDVLADLDAAVTTIVAAASAANPLPSALRAATGSALER